LCRAGRPCGQAGAPRLSEAGPPPAGPVAGRIGHHQVVTAGDVTTEALQLVRPDEALPDRNLEVRPLELDAVADHREVDVLLPTLRRKRVEIPPWCYRREPLVRCRVENDDAQVVRVGDS